LDGTFSIFTPTYNDFSNTKLQENGYIIPECGNKKCCSSGATSKFVKKGDHIACSREKELYHLLNNSFGVINLIYTH
jgi:hypothetical protein